MKLSTYKKSLRSASRRWREAQTVARAFKSPYRPILAHVIPIRRCNLACTYCNEFDNFSPPVPTPAMLGRLDRLAELGTMAITFSGGEPLLHPDLDQLIARIRSHGALAGLITNGYLLTRERIEQLNHAGLDHLQISVDNVRPDDVSKKSLKILDKKLQLLAEHAEFAVNINSVLGSAIRQPQDALIIARRVRELGLSGTIGIIHDHTGQLQPLTEEQQQVFQEIVSLGKESFANFSHYQEFNQNLIQARPNTWHCRAGCRYLYICEDGLVHYCSQQRGHPGIALQKYTLEHLEREHHSVKACAPYCTISCVHRSSIVDEFREKPFEALARFFPGQAPAQVTNLPVGVRVLTWLFLPAKPGGRPPLLTRVFRKAALQLLGAE